MSLFSLGINHNTAPVEIREQLAFGPEVLPVALDELAALPGVSEGLILSTCNRTELYCVLEHADGERTVREWLIGRQANNDPDAASRFYTFNDDETVRHLLGVACGLDSLVLGEPQILGQLKQAYALAGERGCVNTHLNRLMQFCFAVAKEIRSNTGIGSNPVSVAFAAVSLAKQVFGDFTGRTAVLVGAGETIELAAQYLEEKHLGRMVIANRSLDRAHELAERHDGYGIALHELSAHIGEADIVIASTASPDPVITRDMMTGAIAGRKRKPVFMVDIAVPRDIESSVAELDDIYLYTIDDLKDVIEENMKIRQDAAAEARVIIEHKVAQYLADHRGRDAVPLIRQLRDQADSERLRTLEQAQAMLAAGKSPEEVLQFLSTTLTNRILHSPTLALRDAAADTDEALLEAARRLFDLDSGH